VKSGTVQGWEVSPEKANSMLRESDSSGQDLREIVLKNTILHHVHKSHLFQKVKIRDPRMRRLVEEVDCRDFVENDCVCQKGEKDASMIVLLEGEFVVHVGKHKKVHIHADVDQHKVHLLAEQALLGRCIRLSTVQVRSTFATVCWVSLDNIWEIFGGVDSLLQEQGLTYENLYEQISHDADVGGAIAAAERDGKKHGDVFRDPNVPDQLTYRDGTTGPPPPRSVLRQLGHRARTSLKGVRSMGSLAASNVVARISARISDVAKRRKQKITNKGQRKQHQQSDEDNASGKTKGKSKTK